MKINVLGVATTKFGELWKSSPRTLANEAVTAALHDGHIDISAIEAIFVGNMLSGILGGQEHLGAFFAEELGVHVPACKVEGACASGGLAMHNAVNAILSGQYATVLVLGVEKMTDHGPGEVATALMGAGSSEERFAGGTFPAMYALMARMHMEQYGTTEMQMAAIAVKNHYHASLNLNAQFRKAISIEQVMKSGYVADPLKLLDCSPISDGASAVILTSRQMRGVEIVASCVATDSLGIAQRQSLTTLAATEKAAKQAYQVASLQPQEITVAEVHDCFTIAEILAMEDLGFYEKGKAAQVAERYETQLGVSKKLIINPSGGLKGCGHPVGATGVKQIVEITQQLRGKAGDKQVADVQIGLTHNVGGSGATAVVHILKNNYDQSR